MAAKQNYELFKVEKSTFIHESNRPNCLAFSPSNPSRLALQCKRGIMLFDEELLFCEVILEEVKLSMFEWHPVKKDVFAYACSSGIIAFMDLGQRQKGSTRFKTSHKRRIYSLTWGPCFGSSSTDKLYLYSCGDGDILIHNPEAANEPAQNFIKVIKNAEGPFYTDAVWKSDFTLLAVGTQNGIIMVFSKTTSTLVYVVRNLGGEVWSLKWHPKFLSSDLTVPSKYHCVLAAGMSTNHIHIFLVKNKVTVGEKPFKTLKGHTDSLYSLDWNPHVKAQLASGSRDKSVKVWDGNVGKILVEFKRHESAVQAIKWSPVDSDLIYSADSYGRISMWRPSKQPSLSENKMKTNTTETCKKKVFFPDKGKEKDKTENGTTDTKVTQELSNSESSNKVSKEMKNLSKEYDHSFSAGDTKLHKPSNDTIKFKEITSFVATDLKNLIQLLKDEPFKNISELNQFLPDENPLWKTLIQKQPYTDCFDVAISPMVSMSHWKSMCSKHALRMSNSCNLAQSSAFYHCVGDYESATLQLTRICKNLHIESYIYAKHHLSPDHPLIKETFNNIQQMFNAVGEYALSALFHISVGDISAAMNSLEKIQNAESLQIYTNLAYENNLFEVAEEHSLLCLKMALLSGEYDIIDNLPFYKSLKWVVTVHKNFMEILNDLKSSKFSYGVNYNNLVNENAIIWNSYSINNNNYLSYIFNILKNENLIHFEDEQFRNEFCTFEKRFGNKENVTEMEEVFFYVSLCTCKILYILKVEEDIEKALGVLCDLMYLCISWDAFYVLNKICIMFLPFNLIVNEAKKIEFELIFQTEDIIFKLYEWLKERVIAYIAKIDLEFTWELKDIRFDILSQDAMDIHVSEIIFTFFAINILNNLSNSFNKFLICSHTRNSYEINVSEPSKKKKLEPVPLETTSLGGRCVVKCYKSSCFVKALKINATSLKETLSDTSFTNEAICKTLTDKTLNGETTDVSSNEAICKTFTDETLNGATTDVSSNEAICKTFTDETLNGATTDVSSNEATYKTFTDETHNGATSDGPKSETTINGISGLMCETSTNGIAPNTVMICNSSKKTLSHKNCTSESSSLYLLDLLVRLFCKDFFKVFCFSEWSFHLSHSCDVDKFKTILANKLKLKQDLMLFIHENDVQIKHLPNMEVQVKNLKNFIFQCIAICECDSSLLKLRKLHKYVVSFMSH